MFYHQVTPHVFQFLISSSQQVLPIISEFGYNSPYTVPAGKNLIILGTNNSGIVNNLPFNEINDGGVMMVKSGDVLSSSNTTRVFHGYLVDQHYFANCRVDGGSFSSSSLDSTMVANMISSSVGTCEFGKLILLIILLKI